MVIDFGNFEIPNQNTLAFGDGNLTERTDRMSDTSLFSDENEGETDDMSISSNITVKM